MFGGIEKKLTRGPHKAKAQVQVLVPLPQLTGECMTLTMGIIVASVLFLLAFQKLVR